MVRLTVLKSARGKHLCKASPWQMVFQISVVHWERYFCGLCSTAGCHKNSLLEKESQGGQAVIDKHMWATEKVRVRGLPLRQPAENCAVGKATPVHIKNLSGKRRRRRGGEEKNRRIWGLNFICIVSYQIGEFHWASCPIFLHLQNFL